MLDDNDIKEELSYAYVHAVAARAGYSCDRRPKDRDSVDAVVWARGRMDPNSIIMSPHLELQLKATSVSNIGAKYLAFKLPMKNYNDLRNHTLSPRLLLVFIMPDNAEEWLHVDEDKLIARRCTYWCNLSGEPSSNNKFRQTVHVPRTNLFTPQALQEFMKRCSLRKEIGRVL